MSEWLTEQGIFLLRVIVAGVCGLAIGIERQSRMKTAGVRTHFMVAVASSVMMLISKYGFADVLGAEGVSWDVSRVAAGIITGLGILGGGLVFIGKQGYVSGITTAAGVWVTVGVGMAMGAGMYGIGIVTTILVVSIQTLFHKNLWVVKQATRAKAVFLLTNEKEAFEKVTKELGSYDISMNQFKWERKGENVFQLRCQVLIPSKYGKEDIFEIFTGLEEVESFEVIQ